MMTRGIKHDVDRFIQELAAKYLPFKFNNQDCAIQVAVRPIQLWEIVYPEEQYDIMMSTLFPDGQGKSQHRSHDKFIWALRKILGVDKQRDFKIVPKMPVYDQNVEKIFIGIKEDRKQPPDGMNEML